MAVEGSPREFVGLSAELKCGPPGLFFKTRKKMVPEILKVFFFLLQSLTYGILICIYCCQLKILIISLSLTTCLYIVQY